MSRSLVPWSELRVGNPTLLVVFPAWRSGRSRPIAATQPGHSSSLFVKVEGFDLHRVVLVPIMQNSQRKDSQRDC
jgi:hypothetical protein